MIGNLIKGVGSVVKTVAGGAINRTISRLTGAGIRNDSRIVNARAKWSGRDSKKDWRVRLTIPSESDALRNYFFSGNPVLDPLKDIGGIFWPLTPAIVIQHSAAYNPLAQTHSNYPFQAYQNSQVDSLNIIGEFPVQNQDDALHWVATIKFLRTVTKMFFGTDDDFKGNPPPIMHMSGYGTHMFERVPVVINSFNVELRPGIDYISTQQSQVYRSDLSELADFDYQSQDATWAPTLSNISVLVTPIYSRESIKNFNLKDFASGKLDRDQGIGFI